MEEEQGKEFSVFAGIDWGSEEHQVCAMTATRKLLGEREVAHSGNALQELADWLIELAGGESAAVAVAIEVPHGGVVETLLERKIAVFAINPKQLDRFRDRYSASGAKDDRRDALVAADALRTDQHAFRRVVADPALIVELREQGRIHDELREQQVQLSNRLYAQIWRSFPQVLKLGDADEPWIWSLLELVPTAEAAKRVRRAQLEKLLKSHRIRRHQAADVLSVLREASPALAAGTAEAASRHITVLIEQLRLVHHQQQRCDRATSELLSALKPPSDDNTDSSEEPSREPCDVEILLSLPGAGDYVVATVLAEAYQPLGNRDYSLLRKLSGSAPVTKRSSKMLVVHRRYACSERLRNACFYWAQSAVTCDDYTRRHYARLRASGHSHGRACRGVADRLLDVAVAMLRNRSVYDPARRGMKKAA